WDSMKHESRHDARAESEPLPVASCMARPSHCKMEAYELFVRQVPRLSATDGLWRAAMAVAMQGMDDVDLEDSRRRLDDVADRVSRRVPHLVRPASWRAPSLRRGHAALVEHLHDALFDEAGFHGNTEHYYDPAHSYLPAVL